jgi:hypothetical protein
MSVPTKFEFLFWDFEVSYPPFSRPLIVVVCFFSLIVHHLEDIGDAKISKGLKK